jgi:hypothetical protein
LILMSDTSLHEQLYDHWLRIACALKGLQAPCLERRLTPMLLFDTPSSR